MARLLGVHHVYLIKKAIVIITVEGWGGRFHIRLCLGALSDSLNLFVCCLSPIIKCVHILHINVLYIRISIILIAHMLNLFDIL